MPAPEPVALLAAAVEAYDADHAAAQAAFHAGARRGRPEMPETVGTRLRLRYAGVRLTTSASTARRPGTYRVQCGHGDADLEVDFVNAYERRVACGGRIATAWWR